MKDVTRLIGLSLGADLCWPVFFEDIVRELDPVVTLGNERIRFKTERVTIEPFDLEQPVRYDVVLDRLTPWYPTSREWIKKGVVMNGLYVLNNPFTYQAMKKHTAYAAMMRLGLPVPATWMLPPYEYEHVPDLQITLDSYARPFDLREIGDRVGYPAFLKPYDGGAWVGVSRVESFEELQQAYQESGVRIMHLQAAIEPFDLFVRALGVGPQVNVMRYDPAAPLHDRYKVDTDFLTPRELQQIEDITLVINTFFEWDFNSCEALRRDGVFHPIDFANANPDSQVTSLHFHIPWLVRALIRWSLFCAATRRPMRLGVDWEPYFEIAEGSNSLDHKIIQMADVARHRFDAAEFTSFCETHLQDLDEVALAYFGEDRAKLAVNRKVAALFPEHEIEEFTEHLWKLLQDWRSSQTARG